MSLAEFDEEFDIVVAGSGASGLSAAVTAADRGRRVLVLEKADRIGGTTRKAAAAIWVPNNHLMQESGIDDPRDEAIRYMARTAFPTSYIAADPRFGLADWEYEGLSTLYDRGAEAIRYFVDLGAMSVVGVPSPDYLAHLPENAAPVGRAFAPARAAGGPSGGEELIQDLSTKAEQLGVEIRTGAAVVDVIVEGDHVVGVVASDPDGTTRIGSSAVVFGTGGFTHNKELRKQFLRGPYVGGCAAVTNTGDLIPIAQRIGAELTNMANAWSAPIALERFQRDPKGVAGSFVIAGDGLVMVNKYGRRFVNEKQIYPEAVYSHFVWDGRKQEYPNIPCILIWDDEVNEKCGDPGFGNPIPPKGEDPYWVVEADTLEALQAGIAERLPGVSNLIGDVSLDPEFTANLLETVKRYNDLATTGVDEDFHRGETPVEEFFAQTVASWSGVLGAPNHTMRPLRSEGPYYAALLGPGTLDTKGGPRVDTSARVLRHDGTAIDGLFAVGNCAGMPNGQGYWGGGGTIGPILTYGYLAGLAAAGAGSVTERVAAPA